jgi:hypothetical protein
MVLAAPDLPAQGIEQAPDIRRRIRIPLAQALGIFLFLMFPLAALLGLFDGPVQELRTRSDDLELRVQAPARLCFRDTANLRIHLRNDSPRALERVVVRLPASYVESFSQVHFVPAPSRAYEFELLSLAPGETRSIAAELQGEHYGRITGRVEAEVNSSRIAVPLRTFVFP